MATVTDNGEVYLPAIPTSAGALIFDRADRLLILKPTYKSSGTSWWYGQGTYTLSLG